MPPWFPGAAAPLDDAAERLRATRAKEKAVREELRALEQRRRRETVRQGQGPPLPSPALSAVLLLLFYFTSYETAVPVEYWERQRLPKLPREVLAEKLDDLFLHTDPFDVMELADPQGAPRHFLAASDPTSARALRLSRTRRYARHRAAAFLTKVRLRSWVEKANAERGLAPTTSLLIDQYNKECRQLPEPLRPRALEDPATCCYARVFARRWRQLVGGKIGKLRVQDYISLEEKRAKAASLFGVRYV